jgi:hypothetical protein
LMLAMRYSSGQLFYQVVVHAFEQLASSLSTVIQLLSPGCRVVKYWKPEASHGVLLRKVGLM